MFFFKKKPNITELDMSNIPKHIGVIMDGNGRWAKRRGLPRSAGHKRGADILENICDCCNALGVRVLTVYAFSTENWSRPQKEIDALMDLLYDYLMQVEEKFRGRDMKLKISGDISPLSDKYTEAEFEKLVAEAKKTLSAKALLATNQHIPGVGNGVTQDILFNARINPKQKVLLLSDNQKEVLFNALKKTLADMTSEGGRDTQTDLYGNAGGYKTILSAKTWKNPCLRCGSTIIKEAYMGGSVYYCPTCQQIKE